MHIQMAGAWIFYHSIMRDLVIDQVLETKECSRVLVEPQKCEKCNKTSSTWEEFLGTHEKNTSCLCPLKIPLTSILGLVLGLECNECHYTCKKITELNKHLTSDFFIWN